ncbi:hypothetical protein PMIN05_006829 [Paraphaeosphaeria minitans]
MRRTIYTALLTFQTMLHFNPDLRIIALPELQETSDFACDTGSSLAQLQREFAGKPVDLSHLFEGWNEGIIAVVAHGGFNHYFTEDWEGSSSCSGTDWKNCEYRTYRFDASFSSAVERAAVVETDDSVRRRFPKGDHQKPTPTQQHDLRIETEESWAADR